MPIYALLKSNGSFEPEEVAMLGKVFEDVLQTLGLVDREDPLTSWWRKAWLSMPRLEYATPIDLRQLPFRRSLSNSNKFSGCAVRRFLSLGTIQTG
jgi:hypothetical protein